jgi:hypothetical protein
MLGSELLVDAFRLDLDSPISAFMWLISMLVGIVYQTSVWRRQELRKAEREAAAVAPVASPI